MSYDPPNISPVVSGLVPSGGEGPSSHNNLLRTFTAISRALNLAQPLPETLDLIAEKVSRTMGHKYCAVLLANQETKELLIEGSFGLNEEYVNSLNSELKQSIEGKGPTARSVTAQAYRTRMPVYAPDITVDPRFELWRKAALRAGYKSIVALPLIFRGKVIGVLNCYDEPRQYTEAQVEALMVVAEQAASAVGITRLIENQRATIENLDSVNRHVVSQHEQLQRSEQAHDTLISLLLENRSLDDITSTLSELLGSEVVLQDEEFRVLSRSRIEDDYPGLARDRNGRRRLEQALSKLEGAGGVSSLEFESRPGQSALVVPLDLGGPRQGYLSAPLDSETEKAFFRRTLEQAATAYALYMIRQRVAQETVDRIRGDLLADLLTTRFRDQAQLWERTGQLGLDFHRGPFRIFAARYGSLANCLQWNTRGSRSTDHARARLLSMARAFAARADSGAAGLEGDHLVVLLPQPQATKPHRTAKNLLDTISRELPGLDICVGVSAWCERPEDLAPRYEETRTLLDLTQSLGSRDHTACYDDWQAYGLLLHGAGKSNVLNFARGTLHPLLTQNRPTQDILLLTLRTYLDSGLSPTRTAKSLCVHINTVKYRLNRTSELLGLDLDNLDNLLTIKVALMVASLHPADFTSIPE